MQQLNTLSGKLEYVTNLLNLGFITIEQAKEMLNYSFYYYNGILTYNKLIILKYE